MKKEHLSARWPRMVVVSAGIWPTTLGLVGLVGWYTYFTGLMIAHGGGRAVSVMAVHVAAGCVVLGVGVLALTRGESRAAHRGAPRWLPGLVGAGVAMATLLLWQALLVREHKQIEWKLRAVLTNVQSETVARMDARILALVRIAQRWEYAGPPPQQQWEFEAGLNLHHFPGYQAIVWVDPSAQMRWLVARDTAQTAHSLRVALEQWWRQVVAAAEDRYTVTHALELEQEGKGFAVFVPLFQGQDFGGFLIGVFGCEALFGDLLKHSAPGHGIAVFDGAEEIYRRASSDRQHEAEWGQEAAINPYGVSWWRVRVWPQAELLTEELSSLPAVVLSSGIILAVLLAGMVALAQTAQRRAGEAEAANQELNREMFARQQTQEALQKAHQELELRVQERTAELARANESLRVEVFQRARAEEALARQAQELARSNRELEQFAHVASHDLQEPLRKIQAFGDRLKVKCGTALSDEGRDYLKRIQAAAARMQALITRLLTLSRVTTQPQPFVPVDLSEAAREVVADMEVTIQQVGGTVHVGQLPTVDADPLQIRQLLQNLIGNALKFHKNGEPPVVKVQGTLLQDQEPGRETHAADHQRCQISVQDNGIGFDEKYLDRIFNPFQRLHGQGEYAGTGMGLAICRKIVEHHRGQITAKSAPGQGTTFIVTLPMKQPIREGAQ